MVFRKKIYGSIAELRPGWVQSYNEAVASRAMVLPRRRWAFPDATPLAKEKMIAA